VFACKHLAGYQANKAHPCKKEIYCGDCYKKKLEEEAGNNQGRRVRVPNKKFAAV